jgi:EthD domain
MLKINVFLTRRADLTREEFDQYWKEKHTPLLAAMPATPEVVRRYRSV